MIFPNKLCPLQDSLFNKGIFILRELKQTNYQILELYNKVKSHFNNILEFEDTLDLLFVLNKIELKGDILCYIK